MKQNEIHIRDPFILLDHDTYYLYGTRGRDCWGECDGLDCYYSNDMRDWNGPIEIFHRPEGFWADRDYWAPECHFYKGSYYVFVSFKNESCCRGTQILKGDTPLGPFYVHSEESITPRDWECLDGTFYLAEDGIPYMIFCHEWVQIQDGTVCVIRLSEDLKHPVGEPQVLFAASEAPWVRPIRPNKIDVPQTSNFVTDGPFPYRCENGELLIIWSSHGDGGYSEGIARSRNGNVLGPWIQDETPLFGKNGGHGMIFTSKEGKKYLVLHAPNVTPMERPFFCELEEKNGRLSVKRDVEVL